MMIILSFLENKIVVVIFKFFEFSGRGLVLSHIWILGWIWWKQWRQRYHWFFLVLLVNLELGYHTNEMQP